MLSSVLSPVCELATINPFRSLGSPHRVWAISAVHGETERLMGIHDAIYERFETGDKLVYLGNYTGHGEDAVGCIDEILSFRRMLLARKGIMCKDLVYLRGAQEEMWQKLLQLQFAPDPANVLLWMLGNGLNNTLRSYGHSPHDGLEACRGGVMAITKWTNTIREAVKSKPGHDIFNMQLLRAAHTDESNNRPILFVHAGVNVNRPITEQSDHFWWAGQTFHTIQSPYEPFSKVIRGYDPDHKGVNLNCVTATIDGGCGFGGSLVGAGFDGNGDIFEILES
jgi:serine/threonine protein phosphatase 1